MVLKVVVKSHREDSLSSLGAEFEQARLQGIKVSERGVDFWDGDVPFNFRLHDLRHLFPFGLASDAKLDHIRNRGRHWRDFELAFLVLLRDILSQRESRLLLTIVVLPPQTYWLSLLWLAMQLPRLVVLGRQQLVKQVL